MQTHRSTLITWLSPRHTQNVNGKFPYIVTHSVYEDVIFQWNAESILYHPWPNASFIMQKLHFLLFDFSGESEYELLKWHLLSTHMWPRKHKFTSCECFFFPRVHCMRDVMRNETESQRRFTTFTVMPADALLKSASWYCNQHIHWKPAMEFVISRQFAAFKLSKEMKLRLLTVCAAFTCRWIGFSVQSESHVFLRANLYKTLSLSKRKANFKFSLFIETIEINSFVGATTTYSIHCIHSHIVKCLCAQLTVLSLKTFFFVAVPLLNNFSRKEYIVEVLRLAIQITPW